MDSKEKCNNWLQHTKTQVPISQEICNNFTCIPLFGDNLRRRGLDHGQQFVLFHNFKHYTKSSISCIHVNTTKLCSIMCTLVATCVILQSLECIHIDFSKKRRGGGDNIHGHVGVT